MKRIPRVEWQRFEQPVLSAMTSPQNWSRVVLYSPAVVRRHGLYRMWYCGCDSFSRSSDIQFGCAESEDGLTWRPHPDNPILTSEDLPFGMSWQTPFVMFDEDVGGYRMWFVSVKGKRDEARNRISFSEQRLGHAEPQPLRRPLHVDAMRHRGGEPFSHVLQRPRLGESPRSGRRNHWMRQHGHLPPHRGGGSREAGWAMNDAGANHATPGSDGTKRQHHSG